jgi:hypothetical protein
MKKHGSIFIISVVAALLAGCTVQPVQQQAGGDDFPNMIASAGTEIAGNLNQSWENPASASSKALSGMGQTALPDLNVGVPVGKRLVLPKRTARDTVSFQIDLTGLISVFVTSATDSTIKRDTLIAKIRGTDTLLVALRGIVIRTRLPLTVESYRYVDFDGDSLLINPGAQKQQALAVYQRQALTGTTEMVTAVVDAGSDGDFQKEADNRFVRYSLTITLGADTLSYAEISDADGDGYLVDNGSSVDSCMVDIVTKSHELLQPATTTTARMVVFTADSMKNYAVRYGVVNRYLGRTVTWRIVAADGDTTFYPGDTINVSRIVEPAGSDSFATDTCVLRAVLGADPRDSLDDALIGISLHTTNRSGRETVFRWNAATPVKSGQLPRDGTVFFRLASIDKSWIEVTGTISETSISAEVTTSGGKKYTVVWDSSGQQLSITERN